MITPFSLTQRRAWIEIDLNAVRSNVTHLRDFVGRETEVLAIVKADAYGHGLVPVAKAAVEAGAAWLGVATAAEGVTLREAGLTAPIALLCAAMPQEAEAIVRYSLTASVGDRTLLKALAQAAKAKPEPVAIHLEIESGMGRSGVLPEEAVAFWQSAVAQDLKVPGLMTHFADADGPDEDFTREQVSRFVRSRQELERGGAAFQVIHVSNSAAALRFPDLHCNLVRPGLLLYGIHPAIENPTSTLNRLLCPALTLKARVATVRDLPAGHAISYGATYRLPYPARVATVLLGYGDGYPRRLSNCGSMLLRGQRAPILGRVCMDQTVVDVTHIPGVASGEEVVCIGRQGEERISVETLADLLQTTEHEIPTCLTSRLPRLYL